MHYYIVALARFRDPNRERERIEAFKAEHHFGGQEFSFHEIMAQRWRSQVFDFVSTLDFSGWVLVVDKRKLSEFYQLLDNRSLYVSFLAEAVTRIPVEMRHESILVLDEIDRSGEILNRVRRGLQVRGVRKSFKKIVAKRSSSEPLIQVADLIAGVVHRWKRYGETTLLEGVAHKLDISEFREDKKSPG